MADAPAPSSQNMDGFWLIAILSLIFFSWVSQGGPQQFEAGRQATSTWRRAATGTSSRISNTSSRTSNTKGDATSTKNSPYAGKVKISSKGNAMNERWADHEYIAIQNISKESVIISGWYLQNGRDQRGFINNFNLLTPGTPDTIVIPTGVRTLLSTTAHRFESIVLAPREKAIITSGEITKKASFLGPSFMVNECSGYINEYPGYSLQPKISNKCPRPSTESGLDLLEDTCHTFVKRLRSCHTPVYREEMQKSGELRQYLDNSYGLSRICREYVQNRFNYQQCVLTHMQDADFYQGEWRIYLNRRVQMWDSGRERITLYDAQGRLVDELKY